VSWELFVPIAVLAVAIAIVRAVGVLVVKPRNTDRVYTKPVISGSWGQQQPHQSQSTQIETESREPIA
jgi:hypothetical protein